MLPPSLTEKSAIRPLFLNKIESGSGSESGFFIPLLCVMELKGFHNQKLQMNRSLLRARKVFSMLEKLAIQYEAAILS